MQQPPAPPTSPPSGGPQFPVEAPGGPPVKKKRSVAKTFLLVLLALVVVVGGSCTTCVCIGLRRAQHAVDQDDADRRAAKSVPVGELCAAYRSDPPAADGTYKGKWIVVTGGQVDGVTKSAGDTLYVMVGTGKALEVPEVQCLLRGDQGAKTLGLG